jgi:branched-chain amino acid aminotransferase
MATVLVNGEFLEASDARIGVFDAGLQHGVGLFETMTALVAGGESKVIGLDEHLHRLIVSAKELGLVRELHRSALEEAIIATVEHAGDARQRVRLTITGGDLNLASRSDSTEHQPTVIVVTQPLTPYPQEMYDNGVSVVTAGLKINPLDESQGHKTLNYWMRLRELQRAAAKRAHEALVFQVTNYLAGGCVSNVLIVKNDRVITPIARGEETSTAGSGIAVPSPVLPGITRATVLDWAQKDNREIVRRLVTIDDILTADELLLTNSIFGVLPVTRIENQPISTGSVGPFAASMIARWKTLTAI